MKIKCRLKGHQPVSSNIWNDGYFFTRCVSCDCELIGRGGYWKKVPRGYRVVWRPTKGDMPNWKPVSVWRDGSRLSEMFEGRTNS